MKVTLGSQQAVAVLLALSAGIDHMQDEIDFNGRDALFKQSDADSALAVFRKIAAAMKESE